MLSVLILFSCSKDSETSEIILNPPIKQYSLSVSSESGGVVSTTGGVFTEGTLVNIQATANPGYSFTGWSNGSTTNPLPITMTSDISITANFSLIPVYTITVSAEDGGSVSSEGGEYQQGTQLTLTATPDEGYEFSGWSDGSTEATRVITASENLTLTASFSELIINYTLTVSSGEGGSVNSEGGEYQEGTEVTLTASASEGYRFIGWSDGTTEESITITLNSDTAITANFELIPVYMLTVTGAGGVVTGAGEYQEGTEVTLTATPNEGYEFSSWSDGNTDQSRTITITQNTTLTANFSENTQSTGEITPSYTLTVNAGAGGSVSSTGGTYDEGVQVTISATPDSGYSFSSWSDGSTDQSRTITITQNTTLTANFSENTTSSGGGSSGSSTTGPTTTLYTLSVTAGAGGIVNTSGGEYEVGTSLTLTATPNTGYAFTGWSGNATGTDTSLTITINGNTSITANFEAITYTLTVNAGTGGAVSSSGGTYAVGTQVTISATPDSGYSFINWSDGSTDQSRTITLSDNTSITANFEAITYTLTVNAGTGGAVSSSGGTYAVGTQVTITATPDSGNAFYNWSDGSTENPRTISITEDYTISAEFGSATHSLSTNSTNGGIVLVNGVGIGTTNTPGNGGTFNHGEQVNLSTEAIQYFEFKSWSGASTSTSPNITLTMNSDLTITANFDYIIDTSGTAYALTVNSESGGRVNWLFRTGATSQAESSTLTQRLFYTNDEITLTAIPSSGNSFVEWECTSGCSGNTFGTNEVLELTITDSDISVIAKFQ